MSGEPVPLGDSLQQVIRSLRPLDAAAGPSTKSVGDVFGRWEEVVGRAVAANVRPIRLDSDRLVVEVDDPAWATQLRVLEGDLRERLQSIGVRVDRIEVRVGRRGPAGGRQRG
jgi:hypothetical protein